MSRTVRFSLVVFSLACATPAAAQPRPTDPDEGTLSSVTPRIPEPMVFDLVRPLGARRGEVEVNSLFGYSPVGAPGQLAWAPEVEYTFADGHGIEFELPVENARVDAYKGALQGTLPGPWSRTFVHGWQAVGEKSRQGGRTQIDLLYLAGTRWHPRWSAFTMTGVRRERDTEGRTLLGNYSLFYHVGTDNTIGLESNLARRPHAGHRLLLMPQVHLRHGRLNFQAGAGLVREHGATALRIAWRISREF